MAKETIDVSMTQQVGRERQREGKKRKTGGVQARVAFSSALFLSLSFSLARE